MKTIKSALVIAAAFGLTMTATTASAGIVGLDKSTATQLCVTAATGTKVAMHLEIKGSGWSKNFVQDNVKCNGSSIGFFASQHGSDGVQHLLPRNTKVEIRDLAQVSGLNGRVEVSK